MPHSGQCEPDGDGALRQTWRGEQLTHGEKVGDARGPEQNDERGISLAVEFSGADGQRQKQDGAERVDPARWHEFHCVATGSRNLATVSFHSSNQAAVRGAFSGASRSSAAS